MKYKCNDNVIFVEPSMNMSDIMVKNSKVYISLIRFNAVSKLPAPRIDSSIVWSNPFNKEYNMVCMKLNASKPKPPRTPSSGPGGVFLGFKEVVSLPIL